MKIIDIKYKLVSNKEIHYIKQYEAEVLIGSSKFNIEFEIEYSAFNKNINIKTSGIDDKTMSNIKQWIRNNI